ncbi:MAG TPA: hypothetical protein PK878_20445 [bacterium]|nr:hypothetical protein [Candidatus Omnitrophota bacterium]HOJ62652.1 hypothetical protein [bacterium]HOL93444.1 hypothetical protein [bacterium]HPP03158.1 hypothetical protein [bacterium]HXK92941.1 hypothetical protein [bacterium]
MNESQATTPPMVEMITNPAMAEEEEAALGRGFFHLTPWEIIAIALSFCLIAFVALPSYFKYLEIMRGRECSKRLTLFANCLKYLAEKNHTQPGERICELFDLNETLEMAQRLAYEKAQLGSQKALFFKVGAEPDCPAGGDYTYSLTLGADGNIVLPTCSHTTGPNKDFYIQNGLCTVDVSKVDGKIGLK